MFLKVCLVELVTFNLMNWKPRELQKSLDI